MAYNEAKDICIAEVGEFAIGDETFKVSLWSYDSAPPKVLLRKTGESKNGTVWSKSFGRFSKEEIRGFLPLLQKALET